MKDEFNLNCPIPLGDHATVQLAHGGGGRLMRNLIEGLFLPAFSADTCPLLLGEGQGEGGRSAPPLSPLPSPLSPRPLPPHDSAVLPAGGERLAFTTDSYVVNPLFFPGGDIGKLAVYGTVNDLAMAGAKPAYLSAGFILEEGLPMELLGRVVNSMAEAARTAGVRIVTGDTKVVDRGKGDGVFINTAGVGWVPSASRSSPARVVPGDVILLSGDLGRHGVAIMSVREWLRFEGSLESDSRTAGGTGRGDARHGRRPPLPPQPDAWRTGLGAERNRRRRPCGHRIGRSSDPRGRAGCRRLRALGLDPLYVANEGRLVAFVPACWAERVLEIMRRHPAAVGPTQIGAVIARHAGMVELRTRFGGRRIVDLLSGEQMPRIC